MAKNENASKKAPVSTKCIGALGIAALFVADATGQGRMNWILGVFLLAVMGWAAVEMLYAMDNKKHPEK